MISSVIFRFNRVILPGNHYRHYRLLFIGGCIDKSRIEKRVNYRFSALIMPKRKVSKTLCTYYKGYP